MDPAKKNPESALTPTFNHDFSEVIKPLLDPSLERNIEYLVDHYNRVLNLFLESAYKDIKHKANEKIKLEHPCFEVAYEVDEFFKCSKLTIPLKLLGKINEVFQTWLLKVRFAGVFKCFVGEHNKDLITRHYIIPNERLYAKEVHEWDLIFEYDNPYLFLVSYIPKVIPKDESNLNALLWKDRTEEESSADIEFEVGQKRYRAHSSVVSVSSRALKKLCTTTMKERNSPTKKIEADQPENFEEFLYLMYHRNLRAIDKKTIVNLTEIIKLTDKYDSPDLSSIVLIEIFKRYPYTVITHDNFVEIFEATLNLYSYVHNKNDHKGIDDFLGKIFKFANSDLKLCENIASRVSDAEECKKFKQIAKQTTCQNIIDALDEMMTKRIFGTVEN